MLHIKKIKPLFTSIITTADRYEDDIKSGGIITSTEEIAGTVKLYQKVIAVGPLVRDIQEGDMVMINPVNYIVRKFDKNSIQNDLDNNPKLRIVWNFVTLDDDKGEPQDCLLLNDRDISYVFEGEEKADVIIKPAKKKILVN